MIVAIVLHLVFSLGFMYILFNRNVILEEHTLWVDIMGLISYIVVGFFIEVSDRDIYNLLSASSVTIVGLLFWLLLFLIYVIEMNNGKEFSFVGPEVIWFYYLPYIHGSFYISLHTNISNNGYLFGYVLLLNNLGITLLIYLTIKFKQRIKKQ